MKIIILSAGRGTRLAPITDTTPKALAPVLGKPILGWVLDSLPVGQEVIIVHGYLGKQIVDFCESGGYSHTFHFVEQKTLGGTWDALTGVKPLLSPNESFLVIQGDTIHKRKYIETLLGMDRAYAAQENSRIKYSVSPDEDGFVTGLHFIPAEDAQAMRHETTGAYVLDYEAFALDPVASAGGETGIPQTLLAYYDDYKIPFFLEEGCIAIDTARGVQIAEETLSQSDEY